MKRLSILLVSAALAAPGLASTGAGWLSYPGSAANVAEAGGLGGLTRGLDALGVNAAALAELDGRGQVQAGHSSWAADINVEHLGGALRAPWGGVMALSGSWVDFGSIPSYQVSADGWAQANGTLRPNAGSLELAWATRIFGSGLSLGAGLSLLQQDLDGQNRSLAPSAELGLLQRLPWGLKASLSLLQVGPGLDGSDLPTEGRLGLAWASPNGGLALGVEAASQSAGQPRPDLRAGVRVALLKGLDGHLGLQALSGADPAPSAGVSFNLGQRASLDYAYLRQGDAGASHHLSLSLRWDAVVEP